MAQKRPTSRPKKAIYEAKKRPGRPRKTVGPSQPFNATPSVVAEAALIEEMNSPIDAYAASAPESPSNALTTYEQREERREWRREKRESACALIRIIGPNGVELHIDL